MSNRERPTSLLDELYMVRGMRESLSTNKARKVLECIKKGLNCPKDELPHIQKKAKSEQNVDAIVDVLSGIARKVARENDIAPQMYVLHSELVALARGHWDECELMKGCDICSARDSLLSWRGSARFVLLRESSRLHAHNALWLGLAIKYSLR